MNEIKKKLILLKEEPKRLKIIVFMGICAIVLIFLSEFLPDGSVKSNTADTPKPESEDPCQYLSDIENKLSKRLSAIKGVGFTDVILSLDSGEEYLFAEEHSTDTESSSSQSSEKTETKVVIEENSGIKRPIVRKVVMPKFNGALIICAGGDDPKVKERVIKAVSAALDLPTNKICVEGRA